MHESEISAISVQRTLKTDSHNISQVTISHTEYPFNYRRKIITITYSVQSSFSEKRENSIEFK